MLFLYLDTHYLSNFAKLEDGREFDNADTLKLLLGKLRHGVEAGYLICPASEFQLMEVTRRPALSSSVCRVQQELSRGYYMKPWWEIYIHQTASSLLTYLERQRDIDVSWLFYTTDSPQVPLISEIEDAVKNAEQFLNTMNPPCETFDKQYAVEKTDLIKNTFLTSLRGGCESLLPQSLSNLQKLLPMLLVECRMSEQELPTILPRVYEFLLNSNYLDHIPYINVFCSLWASILVNERGRKPQSGDLIDVSSLACALYNCNIVTTDTNMKNHIVNRLGLGDKWGSQVFTQSTEDINKLINVISQ